MNLHAIAAPLVGLVNPPIAGYLLRSTGYTTAATGKRVPTYAAPETVSVQLQALAGTELQHVDSLNIQGVKRAAYLPGDVAGVDRANGTGGDILAFPDDAATPATLRGTQWLVAVVLETWDTAVWSKVALVKQTALVTWGP